MNLGAMENRRVLGVDVTNSSVKMLSASGLVGARGDVCLLNRADNLSLARLSFGLNRFERKGFLVCLSGLSVVEGRKEFLMIENLLVLVFSAVVEVTVVEVVVVVVDVVEVEVVDVEVVAEKTPKVVSSDRDDVVISTELCVGLKFIVPSELTPSIFDKVTSINLSTAKPSI